MKDISSIVAHDITGKLVSYLTDTDDQVSIKYILVGLEVALIEQTLINSNGSVTEAARQLGLVRTTLVEKMRKYSITRDNFNDPGKSISADINNVYTVLMAVAASSKEETIMRAARKLELPLPECQRKIRIYGLESIIENVSQNIIETETSKV